MVLHSDMKESSGALTSNDLTDDKIAISEITLAEGEGDFRHTDLEYLLKLAVQKGASDLHLTASYPPALRIDGHIKSIDDTSVLNPDNIQRMFQSITTKEQRAVFQRELELDFFYVLPELARVRVNACQQQGSLSISFRIIPLQVPTIDELGLPKVCKRLVMERRGLVLVTGPTGVGKTTTMAAMINYINHNDNRKVITIEDPIEYVYSPGMSMIVQRNLGNDTRSFAEAVKRATRQNPDVILIGEMRDLETITAALTAAETGHLVLGTLHTQGSAETIDRIIDVFPNGQQQQIRLQLSLTITGVLSQVLLPRSSGSGRVAAFEVMLGTPAIRSLIRDGKCHQIESMLEMGATHGMYTLAHDIKRLLKEGRVSLEQVRAEIGKLPDLNNGNGNEDADFPS